MPDAIAQIRGQAEHRDAVRGLEKSASRGAALRFQARGTKMPVNTIHPQ